MLSFVSVCTITVGNIKRQKNGADDLYKFGVESKA